MIDSAQKRGELIGHLEAALELADELNGGRTGFLIEQALDDTVACKLHVPDRDQLRRVGWWLPNQPERRENQRVAVPPKSQRPPASLSKTRARNAGDTSGA
jgi:hypothetical protein